MPSSIKQFADLKALAKTLKQQEQARAVAEAERLRAEQAAKREADLFRSSIGNVAPLPDHNRAAAATPRPSAQARQHLADEQAALRESLSDEFDVASLLETDAALSFTRSGIGPDVVRKLRKGHWTIQDQLDLHGLRRDDAREQVAEFLRKATRR